MNDFDLFKKCFESRLNNLEKEIINNCEMGMSEESIKRAFHFTRLQLGLK